MESLVATSLEVIHVIFWQSECPKNFLETKLKGSELISLVACFFFLIILMHTHNEKEQVRQKETQMIQLKKKRSRMFYITAKT